MAEAHGLRSAIAARHAAMLQGAAAAPEPPGPPGSPGPSGPPLQSQAPPSPQATQAPPQPQVAALAVREAAGGAAVAVEQVEVALGGGSGIPGQCSWRPRVRHPPPAAARILEALRRCWHRGSGAGGARGRPSG